MPLGLRQLQRGAALRRRDLSQPEEGARTSKKLNTSVGDEGGFAPDLAEQRRRARHDPEAIEKAGYKPGEQVWLALDVASHRVLRHEEEGFYTIDGKRTSTRPRMVDLLAGWAEKYPICSIEDGCARTTGPAGSCSPSGSATGCQLVGDDLFVTNVEAPAARHRRRRRQQHPDQGEPDRHAHRDARGDQPRAAQRLLAASQPPQRRDRGRDDRRPGRRPGHRPDQDRLGRSRSDRMAKYNQLLRIEEMLGDGAIYGGPLFKKK